MITPILALVLFAGCFGGVAQAKRVIRVDNWNVQPWGEPKRLSYNNSAPPNLRHTIKVTSRPDEEYPDFPTAVEVTCSRINVEPKVKGKCKLGFFVYDDKDIHAFCGERENFKIVTENSVIHLLFTNGPNGGGEVECVAQGVYKGSGLSISIGEPAVDPGWFKRPDFSPNSEELNSLEHGSGGGDRSTSCLCGTANKARSRIVDGKVALENEFPWMAALIETDTKKQLCGSTIVSAYHAITAAHCTDGALRANTKLSVIVGAHDLKNLEGSETAKIIDVSRVIQHKDFNWKTVEQDIALLVLSEEIQFTQFVGRVCLPSSRINLDNKYTKVMGWGKVKTGGNSAATLRKLDVRVIPMDTCGAQWPNLKTQQSNQICTYAYRKASCQGDSGGPLVWADPETNRYTLVGVVSYGNTWCGDMFPSVNTEVAAFMDWIDENIKASSPGAETCKKV